MPKDFTLEQMTKWLERIKKAPDEQAIRMLIERIVADKKDRTTTEFSAESTLSSVVGSSGMLL